LFKELIDVYPYIGETLLDSYCYKTDKNEDNNTIKKS